MLTFVSPLLHPTQRIRFLCFLLLTTLVFALIYFGSRPEVDVVFVYLPWDKLVHATAYAGFATLAWVALGSRSHLGAVVVAGAIGLLDEGVQYYSPRRHADFHDLIADLAGATIIVLLLRRMQSAEAKRQLAFGYPASDVKSSGVS